MKKLLVYIKPFWLVCLLSPLFMALEVAMDLTQPRLLQSIIDIGIAGNDVHFVLTTACYMLCAAAAGVVGGVGCTIFSTIAAINFGTSLRSGLFRKIEALSLADIEKLEQGSLITRLTNDIDQIQEATIMILRMLVRSPFLVIGSLIMAVVTSPRLSLLLVVIMPLLVVLLVIINKRGLPLFMLVQKRIDKINSIIEENLSGIRVVKAFVRSDYEEKRFDGASRALYGNMVAASLLMATILPIMMFVINAGIAAALWIGGKTVIAGGMQLGRVLAFITYLTQMANSMAMIGMIVARISRADASAERIAEVLDTEPSIKDAAGARDMGSTEGEVTFENVSFRYGRSSKTVLSDINLTIKPRERVVIMGETGSGKTTLLQLIPRFYDPSSGCVKIDGTDVRDMTTESLRRKVATLLQQTLLFSGSIVDNIRYGARNASMEDITEASKMAAAYDFIADLPDGPNTELGQGGINLSGGQKQRLSIARALVAKPNVLIFDDCTSAVDMTTERRIMNALKSWTHRCTQIIVAQRVSTAMSADRVIVLDKGHIAAQGTHEELLDTCEIYKNIVSSQSNIAEDVVL